MYIIARYGDSSGWGNIAGYRDRRDGRGVVVGEAGVELAQATALHPGNQVLSSLNHYHHPTIIVIPAGPGKALSYFISTSTAHIGSLSYIRVIWLLAI